MSKKYFKSKMAYAIIASLLLSVVTPLGISNVNAASQVTVDWNNVRQEIDGFGFTQEEACTYDMPEPKRSEVLDLLFDKTKGVGFSLLRTEIGCGDVSKPTIEPADGVWNYEADPRELWYFREAKARGLERIFGTAWSPPAYMKTNNSIKNGGYLLSSYYQKYAEYLAEYVRIYKDYHNIDIYGVSFANEPEYAAQWKSCQWTAAQFKNFIGNYVKPTFEARNVNTKLIAGESGIWSEAVVKDALNDPNACSRIDVVASHQYQWVITDFPTARAKGKKVWMTELCETTAYDGSLTDGLQWAKKVHDFMTIPETSAFCYWRGAHTATNNQALIKITPDNQNYETTKRLFTIGNYSKFVKPGYVRIGATEKPVAGVYITAYKNPTTGEFAIVVVNDGDSNRVLDIVPQGFTAGKLTPNITDRMYDLKQGTDIPVVNGKFTASVGAKSVVTFVGTNGSPIPQTQSWTINDDLNDWSKVFSVSPHWMIETGNDYGRYDEDNSCARRTINEPQSLIYKYQNITDFLATIYLCDDTSGISFYTSKDNVTWQPLSIKNTLPIATAKDWQRAEFSPANGVPQGTNYLKVVFEGGASEWNKHLANMKIKCDSATTATIVDNLNDWTKSYSHTNMIIGGQDGANSNRFDGDLARGIRQANGAGEIIYSVAGTDKSMSTFDAKVYYYDGNDDNYDGINFYVSSDGVNWSEQSVVHTSSLPTKDFWYKLQFSPMGNMPTGTKYLKVQFNRGAYEWDKQLSEISIDCQVNPVNYQRDSLNDWTKSLSHSTNMVIENTAAAQSTKFDSDTYTAVRNTADAGNIVYYKDTGINGFVAKAYFQQDQSIKDGIKFYTSVDGVTFVPLKTVYTSQIATVDAWRRTFFTPAGNIPSGTKYLKLEISNGGTTVISDKQISEIILN